MSHHVIIHNLYCNFIILIISIILYYYEKNSSKSRKREDTQKDASIKYKLIYQKDIEEIKQKSKLFIIFGIFIYIIQNILSYFYYLFDLRRFDFWVIELPLLSFFNYKLLKIKIYKHHKFSMYLSVIICTITKIIDVFIYLFSDEFKDEIYNKHKFLYFIGIISFFIIIILRAYSITEMKAFMDFKYVSPSKLLIYMGSIGVLVNIIIMLIFTYNKCATVDNIDIHLCNIVENDNTNREEAYFENFFIYFKILKQSINDDKSFEVIIEVITSFFGSLTYFCYTYFFILIIKYLSSVHYIFYSFIKSFFVSIISIIISIIDNSYFNGKDFNVTIFITKIISDIATALGLLIYCEIIELNFCGFNHNLRRNIIFRSEKDLNFNEQTYSVETVLFDEKDEDNNDFNSVN